MTTPRSNGRLQDVANWLDESPTKKILVATAAALAFLLSLANGGWTIWKEYRALKEGPKIHLVSWESHRMAQVSTAQVLGFRFDLGKADFSRTLMPYFAVEIELSNPTPKSISFSRCVLALGFYGRQEIFQSDGYMMPSALKTRTVAGHPILPVQSGEIKRVDLLFFFLPRPEFEAAIKDQPYQANRVKVTCFDEGGQRIDSR